MRFVIGIAMLGLALVLGASALSRGATPMAWIWILGLGGGVILVKALRLLARINEPSAKRSTRMTPRSWALDLLGFFLFLAGFGLGVDTTLGTVAAICGIGLMFGSKLLEKTD